MKKIALVAAIFIFASLSFGCATLSSTSNKLMPSEKRFATIWTDYDSALRSFKKVEPSKTTLEDLKKMGWDPYTAPNTTFLNPLTVRKIFLGTGTDTLLKMEDLPKDIQDYLKEFNSCTGFKFEQANLYTEGRGNIIKRLLNFKKEDLTTGWRFQAFIFMKNDTVAYVFWEGTPNIKDPQLKKNPLGPLGELFGRAPGIIVDRVVP